METAAGEIAKAMLGFHLRRVKRTDGRRRQFLPYAKSAPLVYQKMIAFRVIFDIVKVCAGFVVLPDSLVFRTVFFL